MPSPKNKKLYLKVKNEAKTKFERYPSARASQWIVKEYKKRGGEYDGKKPKNTGLTRWEKEEWVNVKQYLKNGKKVKCGETNSKDACRPLNRVNKSTPSTISELVQKYGKERVLNKAIKKENNMNEKMCWRC